MKEKKTIKTKPFVVNFPTAYYFLGYASPSWEASTDNKCWHLSCHVSLLSFLRQKKSINSARQSIEVWFCSLHSGGPPTTQGSNKFTGKETGKSHICTVQSCKGQLISERNFGVFKSPNKRTNVASVQFYPLIFLAYFWRSIDCRWCGIANLLSDKSFSSHCEQNSDRKNS